jgi:hypothetical protein
MQRIFSQKSPFGLLDITNDELSMSMGKNSFSKNEIRSFQGVLRSSPFECQTSKFQLRLSPVERA